jgi:hypothetical protein
MRLGMHESARRLMPMDQVVITRSKSLVCKAIVEGYHPQADHQDMMSSEDAVAAGSQTLTLEETKRDWIVDMMKRWEDELPIHLTITRNQAMSA